MHRALHLAGIALPCLLACGAAMKMAGYPPEATRQSQPQGIGHTAIAVGTQAPDFQLTGTKGNFKLADAVASKPAALIFYRGDW